MFVGLFLISYYGVGLIIKFIRFIVGGFFIGRLKIENYVIDSILCLDKCLIIYIFIYKVY